MSKQKLTIYKLHFISPVHIGDGRDDYGVSLKTISSDAIYAALISCLAKVGKDIPNNGDLGGYISSLFPFYQKDHSTESILFFPKPLKSSLPNLSDLTKAKLVKKVVWLDKPYFEKVINGESLFSCDADIDNIHGEYLLSNAPNDFNEKFVTSHVSQRVVVSRDASKDAVPFYMDRVFFEGYSGLYFIVKGETELIETALNILQHEGVGTDRNVGNGFFVYEKDAIELNIPDHSSYAMSLSMYIPESKERLESQLNGEKISYEIVRRGGWVTTTPFNTIRKNVIYGFTAASVFGESMDSISVMGRIVDLKPGIEGNLKLDHSIWRCGKALFIPIKI